VQTGRLRCGSCLTDGAVNERMENESADGTALACF